MIYIATYRTKCNKIWTTLNKYNATQMELLKTTTIAQSSLKYVSLTLLTKPARNFHCKQTFNPLLFVDHRNEIYSYAYIGKSNKTLSTTLIK